MAGRIFVVSNSAQLYSAMAGVKGGDTISLAGGDYGSFSVSKSSKFISNFDSMVTIKSADANNPAVFSGMSLRDVNNITIDGVKFDYTYKTADFTGMRPFQVNSSSNVTIRNSVFDGDVATAGSANDIGYATAIALSVRGSTGITIDNNEVFNFHRGISVTSTSNALVKDNEVHSIRSDGMNFSAVQNTVVENNYIHNFRGSLESGDHRDMIQVWTDGTTVPTSNLIIRGNLLDIGSGSFTQSIFMRNEMVDRGTAGAEMFYRNILIENNTIYNAHLNGITVGEADGLTIRNNSLVQAAGDGLGIDVTQGVNLPRINVNSKSRDVTIEKNVTSDIVGTASATWAVRDNAFIQNSDPSKPGFYGSVFMSTSLVSQDGTHAFVARPGSVIDLLGAGSARMEFVDTTATLNPLFNVTDNPANSGSIFNASFTSGAAGLVTEQKATFIWDFGDGTTAQGIVAHHTYKTAGHYPVTLHVVLKNGVVGTFSHDVGIEGGKLVALNPADGKFLAFGYGETEVLAGLAPVVGAAGNKGIDLGGTGTQAKIGKTHLDDLFGSDNFTLSMTLAADSRATGFGEVARLHQTFVTSVDRAGNVEVQLFRPDGTSVRVKTAGVVVNDTRAHDITVDYSSAEGKLKIFVDGVLAGSGNFTGKLPSMGSHDLMFGNPWGAKNFDGVLKAFEIEVDGPAHPQGTAAVVVDNSAQLDGLILQALVRYGFSAPVIEAAPVTVQAPVPVATPQTVIDVPDPVVAGPAGHAVTTPDLAGYVLDKGALATVAGARMLKDDAHLVTTASGPVVRLDGSGDHIDMGRLTQYEQSDRIAFSVDFSRAVADGSSDRLVWNHQKLGLTLKDDGFVFHVATATEGMKSFTVNNIGLNDTDDHSAVVMIDAAADRVQVIIDDRLVLDRTGTDFDFVGAGGREAGWMLGTPWGQVFQGDIADFRVTDSFSFVTVPDAPLS